MVSLDCATRSDSRDVVNKKATKSVICRNGILPQFLTTASEFPQSLPPNLTSNPKYLNYSSRGINLAKSASLPHFSSSLKTEQPQHHSGARLLLSQVPKKINSKRSDSFSKSSQRITPPSMNSPPVNRSRSLPKRSSKSVLKGGLSHLKSTHFYNRNENATLRKFSSEPCVVYANESNKGNYLCERRYSEKLEILTTKSIQLRTTKSSKKPPSKRIKNEIPKSNSQLVNCEKIKNGKIPSKPVTNCGTVSKSTPTKVPSSSPGKIAEKPKNRTNRASIKRKIDQATQIESQTNEVESQTDLNENIIDQSKKLEKKSSSSTNKNECRKKEPKKKIEKTVIAPFSFMDSVQAWLDKRKERAEMRKKFEIKRWHRPPLILKKKPFKVILPIEQKITVPKSICLETDVRRQKWERFLKEFTARQERINKERQRMAEIEIRNYRKTLKPLITKIPYKKLGIKPKKPIISQFRKLRQQSTLKDPNSWQVLKKKYPDENIANTSNKSNKNKFNQKQNSSKISEIEKPPNGKNSSKTNDKNFPKITTNEKIDSNCKNLRTSFFDIERNNRKKISPWNETESRKQNSPFIKDSSPKNSFTEKDDYDGLYEKYTTHFLSSTDSNKRYKIVRVKTSKKVFQ